jgi:hypothetical protein
MRNTGRSARVLSLILAARCLACGPAATARSEAQEPSATEVPQTTTAAEPDASDPERDADAATPTEPARPPTRVEEAVGTDVATTIRSAKQVVVGRLRTEGALQAEQRALQDDGRVAGYPVATKLRPLPPAETTRIGELLLADESYQFDVVRRCANKSWVGARFEDDGGERVEAALGIPCNQLILVWRNAGTVQRWGAVTTDEAATEMTKIIEAAP